MWKDIELILLVNLERVIRTILLGEDSQSFVKKGTMYHHFLKKEFCNP